MTLPAALKLTPKAFKALRSRVYRSVLVVVLPLLAFNEQTLGHQLDTHVAGLHLPGYIVLPGGAAIIAAVVAFVGGKFGIDPNSTLLDGIVTKPGAPAANTPPADAPDPPTFSTPTAPVTPRPGLFAPDAIQQGSHTDDAAALDAQMLAAYQGADGVDITTNPQDPMAPHGVNQPGETDGQPLVVAAGGADD